MGASDSAARAAQNQERSRQAAIERGTTRVNSVFDAPERAAGRQQFLEAMRERFNLDANEQKAQADRKLKFSMARSGLTGGKAAIDGNATLGRDYTRGLLDAETRAQGGLSDLESQDEQSRLGLLASVRGGMDATTAASRAGAAMQSNANVAQNSAFANGLGDIFGSTADIYKQQQDAQARRRGVMDAYGSLYGPTQKTI